MVKFYQYSNYFLVQTTLFETSSKILNAFVISSSVKSRLTVTRKLFLGGNFSTGRYSEYATARPFFMHCEENIILKCYIQSY